MEKTFIIRPDILAKIKELHPHLEWVEYGTCNIEPERMGELQITLDRILDLAHKCHIFYEDITSCYEEERLYDELENHLSPPICNLITNLCFHAGLCMEVEEGRQY